MHHVLEIEIKGKPQIAHVAAACGEEGHPPSKLLIQRPKLSTSRRFRRVFCASHALQRLTVVFTGLLAAALAVVGSVSHTSGQSDEGWVTGLNGQNMGDWIRVGETNWRLEDGAVVADNRTSKRPTYLVSKTSCKDFQLSWAGPQLFKLTLGHLDFTHFHFCDGRAERDTRGCDLLSEGLRLCL